jgi:ADP-ribose pyrophosphatase
MSGAGTTGGEQILSEETIYRGKLLTIRKDRVRLENGREATREVVVHPGAVAIVPLLPDGRVILVRQYRYAAGRALLEIPAGTLDQPGESPAAAAARELGEETGYTAGEYRELAAFFTAPGFCTEKITVYLATGLTPGAQNQMEDEAISLELVPLADIPAMIAGGDIADAKTIGGLLLAMRES